MIPGSGWGLIAPPVGTKLRKSPYLKGLAHLWVFGQAPSQGKSRPSFDLITGLRDISSTNENFVYRRPGQYGSGIYSNAGGGDLWQLLTTSSTTSQGALDVTNQRTTWAVMCEADDISAHNQRVFGSGTTPFQNPIFTIGQNVGGSGRDNTFGIDGNWDAGLVVGPSNCVQNGVPFQGLWTRRGAGITSELWKDGYRLETPTNDSGGFTDTVDFWGCAFAVNAFKGTVYYIATWNYDLSPAMIKEFQTSPYDMLFEPPIWKRLWVAQATSGVTSNNATRAGARAQATQAKASTVSGQARVGAQSQTTTSTVRSSATSATRVGARSQCTATKTISASNTTRVGVRGQSVVVKAASATQATQGGARAQATVLHAVNVAATTRVGSRSSNASTRTATTSNAARQGSMGANVDTSARSSANAARAGARSQNGATQASGVVSFVASTAGARSQCTATKAVSTTHTLRAGARAQATQVRTVSTGAQGRVGAQAQSTASSSINPSVITGGVARVGARAQCSTTRKAVTAHATRVGAQAQTVASTARTFVAAGRGGARGVATTGIPPEVLPENVIECVSDDNLPNHVVWPDGHVPEWTYQGVFGETPVLLSGCEAPEGALKDWEL